MNVGELRALWTIQFVEALEGSHHSDWSTSMIAEAASVCADRLVATITAVAYKQEPATIDTPTAKEDAQGYM